jgi:DNA-binding FadR family transcriptional regulator
MLLQAPRATLSNIAADSIRAEIANGRWPVGTRIPIEPELAQMLGVSRGTVREAVKTLVSGGLLEARQGSGTYVRSGVDASASLQKLRRASLRDQFELRCALEVEAARLAALRHTDEALRQLRSLLSQRGRPGEVGGAGGFVERDLAFHLAIVDMTGNLALIETCRFVSDHIRETIAATATIELYEPDHAAHAAIVEAIASRDPERAAATVRAFMAHITQALAPVTP